MKIFNPSLTKIRSLYWQRKAPPIERRQKLWKLRLFIQRGGRPSRPYKSPWLPKKRKPIMRRSIHLNREHFND